MNTNIKQLTTINTNELFDTLTAMPIGKAVDSIAAAEIFLKNLKETLDEAKRFIASNETKVDGEVYTLSVTETSTEKKTYDPNRIFQALQPEFKKDFLELVKITKTDFTGFCKSNDLKIKNFDSTMTVETVEAVKKYSIKLKK